MVFNADHQQQQSKRIILPRIDLKAEQETSTQRSPSKSPKKSGLPLRVEDFGKQTKQTPLGKTKSHEHTFRGEREVFLNKGLS